MSAARWTSLRARVLRPERPRLAEARAVVAGVAGVEAAWEALAARGLCPLPPGRGLGGAYRGALPERATQWIPWVPGRSGAPGASGRYGGAGRGLTVDAAVALAADPDGIARAGRRALEAVAGLAVFGAPPVQGIAWRVVEGDWRPAGIAAAGQCRATLAARAGEALSRTAAWRTVMAGAPRGGMRGVLLALAADAAGAALWQRVADVGGEGWDAASDPFEAMLAVWSEGYAIDRIEGDRVVLVAPGV